MELYSHRLNTAVFTDVGCILLMVVIYIHAAIECDTGKILHC